MSKKPDSFLGWLGRQVGFVSKAIKTDVTKPPEPSELKEPKIVYRADKVEEAPHPGFFPLHFEVRHGPRNEQEIRS